MDERKARERVKELKEFYSHIIAYVVINIAFLIVNLLTSPKNLWFVWIAGMWGIGIIFHAYKVFVKDKLFDEEWEEKKVKELTKKE